MIPDKNGNFTYKELLTKFQSLEVAGAGITIADAKSNKLVYANKSFFELTDYHPNEVLYKTCKFLQGPDTDQKTLEKISFALKNKEKYIGEILNYKKSGEPFWNLLAINPVTDESGEVTHFVGFQHDISHLKKTENALTFKTSELNNFIYRTSHNLRGPIASILGVASLAQFPFTIEEAAHNFQLIYKSAKNLDYILHNLVEIVSYNDKPVILSDVKVHNIFQSVLECFQNETIKFDLDIDEHDVITTDVHLLSSALSQVVNNAVLYKKMNDPQPTVTIVAKKIHAAYSISISDNGMGMDEEIADKAFQLFFKGTEQSRGNGIGLYIAKSYIEKLGGKIHLKSIISVGTKVTVILPV